MLSLHVSIQASTQCPDTQLVLSGYSQGGQLVHNAADLISSDVADFVAAGMSRELPLPPLNDTDPGGLLLRGNAPNAQCSSSAILTTATPSVTSRTPRCMSYATLSTAFASARASLLLLIWTIRMTPRMPQTGSRITWDTEGEKGGLKAALPYKRAHQFHLSYFIRNVHFEKGSLK